MQGDGNYERDRIFSVQTSSSLKVDWSYNKPDLVTIKSESLSVETEYIHVFTRSYTANKTKSYLYYANFTLIHDVSLDSAFAAILD